MHLSDSGSDYCAVLPEVRLDPAPSIIESPEPDEGIAGETMIREQLPHKVPYCRAVLPAADIVHEERVGATPINTDIARDVATPVQQIQASLSNGISPGDASIPIQSADTPRQKLAVGTTLQNVEQDDAVKAVGNLQKQRSGEKNKKPLRLLQDWLEDKSSEAERPRICKIASASNSPSALSYTPPWTDSGTLPPSNLEDHKWAPESSSSSLADSNNGSREPEGFHFRAPPPGSYQDDDTGPSPKNLLMAVMGVKSTVNQFAKMLIANMNKHPVEYEHLKQTILQEVGADMDRANHWKFLVQAFICNRMFDGFDAPNAYFGVESFESDRSRTRISFADFTKYKDKAATISMLLDSDSPDGSILGRFCFKKFKSITGEVGSNEPSPVFQEEWSGIEKGYHPKTEFYQNFLKVAVSVWLVHILVHSFEETVDMLIYEKGSTFQRQTMESVVPGRYEEEDEESDANTEVGFSVIPGFRVSRSVVKCEVYLRSKSRNTDMEITGRPSTEMTPAKASSIKTTEKALSAKTPAKPDTPEMPVVDSKSPGSSLYPAVYGSLTRFGGDIPPKVADAGMSGAEADSAMFWSTHRHSLSPDNQGSKSRSGGKSGHDQGSFGVTYPGIHDPHFSSHSLAAPKSRSSTQLPPRYVPRPTRASEIIRRAYLRLTSTDRPKAVVTLPESGRVARSARLSTMERPMIHGGPLAMCGADERAVVDPSENVMAGRRSEKKQKRPGGCLATFQDWLEGKSSDPERRRVRKTASASNSPSALSYTPPWTDSSTLPPSNLEDHKRSSETSSSSLADSNNGSREPEGFHFRAPTPGSDQDDDTGPSPKNLPFAVMGVKSTVNHFAKMLIANMNKHPVEYEHLKQTILQEVGADMDRANHWKFLVQAFICNRMFDGFDAPNAYFGVEYFESYRMTTCISFADFTKYKDKAATISMLLDSNSPDGSILGRFCFKKFKFITGEVGSNEPSPVFQEEWSGIEKGYHPKTEFYQNFLEVAVSVWLVHRLVHSFEETADMLIYEKGSTFQRQTMESVVPGSYEEDDEESDANTEVGFSVIPGFRVSRIVVKCEVYLRSKSRNTDIEITGRLSTEMTPAKASSSKTSSAKSPAKPDTPEMPVVGSKSPRSSLYPEVYGSFTRFGGPHSSSHSPAAPKSRPSTHRTTIYVPRPMRDI